MSKTYYLIKEKQKLGPFDLEELKKEEVSEDCLVWYEGLSDWIDIKQVDELSQFIKKSPAKPPLAPHERQSKAKANYMFDAFKLGGIVYIIVGLLVFVIMGGFSSDIRIEELYPNRGDNAIYTSPSNIRKVLFAIGFLLVGIPVLIAVVILRYNILKRRGNKTIQKPLN